MVQARAVDYVVYNVSDLETAITFYRDTLGLPFDYVYESSWAEFAIKPVSVALCITPVGQAPQRGYRGGATVALAVQDIKGAIEELREKGVHILMEPQESPVCWTATIADPDGNRINLHERNDGTAG